MTDEQVSMLLCVPFIVLWVFIMSLKHGKRKKDGEQDGTNG